MLGVTADGHHFALLASKAEEGEPEWGKML